MNPEIADVLGGEESNQAPALRADDIAKVLTEPEKQEKASVTDIRTQNKETIPFRSQGTSGSWKSKSSGIDLFGGLEAAGSILSGAAAAPIGAVAGIYRGLTGGKYGTAEGAQEAQERAAEVSGAMTYQPRSQSGRNTLEAIGGAFEASKLQGLGPTEAISLGGMVGKPNLKLVPKGGGEPRLTTIPQMVEGRTEPSIRSVPGMKEPQREPVLTASPKLAPETGASVGASGVAPLDQARAMVAGSSPELKAAVEKAGPKIDLEVLQRHAEADSLPVPVRLTKGQAMQDVQKLSDEQNLRGKHPELANRFNEQNKALIENTNAIKEKAAPDVFATSNPEIGEHIIDSYRAKDAAKNAEISALYKKLTDANGGQFPLDSKAFVDSADAALHKNLLYDHVPPEIRKTLDRVSESGMTFENFESLRTNLARIQRSSADGNAKAAAGTIRQALEELPMPAGAEHLKPLADAARSSARERFATIEADPAYKAVVNGKASADKFIDKFVVGADLKNVQTMKQNLAHDPTAQQAMSVGTINHLKQRAGIIEDTGNFSQAGYNKALEGIRPKLGVIFDPEQRAQIETLGRVARYTQAQPRGSFVNASNTATTLIAEQAKNAAENVANVAAFGIPIGTWTRKLGSKIMEGNTVNEMLQAGGGLKKK